MLKDNLEIILVTYNRKESLQKTLESIFEEISPIKDCDINILDNCSTDGTEELCREYAAKYNNLKHIRHHRNIGGNGNISRAVELASKKYLWVLCDDDTYDWRNFGEIERAIEDDYDLIYTTLGETGRINNIADAFYTGSFVPGFICKTDVLTYTMMENMLCNVANFFPHLCIVAKMFNDNKKIYFPYASTVFRGIENDNINVFCRGTQASDLSPLRQNMFWFLGYINSVQMIKDQKQKDFVIDNLRHTHKSLFDLFKSNIYLNKICYKNSFRNLVNIVLGLNTRQKLLFLKALLQVELESVFIEKYISRPTDKNSWGEYFEAVRQKTKIKQLLKKYKNKKVVLYGMGVSTEVLFEKYNLSDFNIVAIADRKFKKGDKISGYNGICMEDILEYNPDVIFICNYQPERIKKSLLEAGIQTKTEYLIKKSGKVRVLNF